MPRTRLTPMQHKCLVVLWLSLCLWPFSLAYDYYSGTMWTLAVFLSGIGAMLLLVALLWESECNNAPGP